MAAEQVGWIGLGAMGIGMSKNLQKYLSSTNSPALIYTNRTLSRGEPLKALGGSPVESIAEVAQKSNIIFSCVSNDAVLQSVADEIVASGDIKGKVFVDCSTVHPDTATTVSQKMAGAGAEFVSAPVMGASPVAEAGKLVFLVAGPETATSRIAPYLEDVMGRAVYQLGPDASKSSMLKIAGNICGISFMEVIAETHVFAEKQGVPTAILDDMLGNVFGPVIGSYSKRMMTGVYAPSPKELPAFDVSHALKDARHAMNLAEAAGARLEVSEVAVSHLEKAIQLQPSRPLDSSAMYGTIRTDAGLDFFTEFCKERDANV